jgi:hypothetical protein
VVAVGGVQVVLGLLQLLWVNNKHTRTPHSPRRRRQQCEPTRGFTVGDLCRGTLDPIIHGRRSGDLEAGHRSQGCPLPSAP